MAEFAVNGKEFPGVPFDIGESYAGLLPITANESDPNAIFFWFFPSSNPSAKKEIALWFQGGPGCSSLTGLLQENGPFLWPPGVAEPYPNPYSWSNLTNMVWIDQPYGIGLARGNTTVKDPIEAAHQFMEFWKHFVRVFSIQGYKINLIGESYGGATVSYFAHEMLAANDTQNFNLVSAQLQDAYIGDLDLQTQSVYLPWYPCAHRDMAVLKHPIRSPHDPGRATSKQHPVPQPVLHGSRDQESIRLRHPPLLQRAHRRLPAQGAVPAAPEPDELRRSRRLLRGLRIHQPLP